MKVKITKVNATNEQIECEVPISRPEDWLTKVKPAFDFLDRRQFELNLRVLAINKQVGKLNPNEFTVLREILAGLNNILIEADPGDAPVPAELAEHLTDYAKDPQPDEVAA
jgi:hypothetical protein